MKYEIVERPEGMETGLKLIPEDDKDVLDIGRIVNSADRQKTNLSMTPDNTLSYGYITIEELIKLAATDISGWQG